MVVDGQWRKGVVDEFGRIKIEGPMQFDIGSDEEPQFGEAPRSEQSGPLAPGAMSPFLASPA